MCRAFGSLAKAWGKVLTEAQQLAWNAAAAKLRSHPRLGQSGRLTGALHFQGINSARARIGRKMLLWPPAKVVFGRNPVAGLAIRYVNGRLRLRLRVTGPVTEEIMVFGQAPCSAGRKKWRHGTHLGLLPAPRDGECDITELYVQRFGEPELGKKVLIRTRQQKDGWEGPVKDCSEVAPPIPVAAAKPRMVEIRSPKTEGRRKPEVRIPNVGWSGRWLHSSGRLAQRRCAKASYRAGIRQPGPARLGRLGKARLANRGLIRPVSAANPMGCTMHKGVQPEQSRSTEPAPRLRHRRAVVRGEGEAACLRCLPCGG